MYIYELLFLPQQDEHYRGNVEGSGPVIPLSQLCRTAVRLYISTTDRRSLGARGRGTLASASSPAPCTLCNKCLEHVIENPQGCYEDARFVDRGGREELIRQVMAIFENEVEAG